MTEGGAVTAHCAPLFSVQTCQFARRPQKGLIFISYGMSFQSAVRGPHEARIHIYRLHDIYDMIYLLTAIGFYSSSCVFHTVVRKL